MPKFRLKEIVEANRNTDPKRYVTIGTPDQPHHDRRVNDYWVVVRPVGERLVLEPHVFEKLYEPVEEGEG